MNKLLQAIKSYRFCIAQSLYQTLGVPEQASFKQIRQQYILKSKALHPDQSGPGQSPAVEQYHLVQKAYKVLSNPEQRKRYDLSLGIRNSSWERELDSASFSDKFESQYYDEILKQENIKVKVTHQSMEDRLHQRFSSQISNFNPADLLKTLSFAASVVGLGVFWLLWNTLQIFLLNYRGDNRHEVQLASSDKALKSIPLFTR